MIISFLIQNLNVRGSVRRMVELSNHLTVRGHDCTIYHSDGSKCEWLPMYARGRPVSDFLKEPSDVVIFYGHPHYKLVQQHKAPIKIFYILGVGPVGKFQEMLINQFNLDNHTRTVWDILSDQDYHLIANCNALCDFITQTCGRECLPVQGGINFKTFKPCAKREPGLVVAGGAKRENEGTADILSIFDMLKQSNPKLKLELYAGKGLSQDELAQLYSRASVFVDAQLYGGWNNAVAEAFACGAPTVCTNIQGNQDFVRSGINAWMLEPHNVNGMYKAARQLLENTELAGKFSQAALEAVKPYTWERATDQLEAVIGRYMTI